MRNDAERIFSIIFNDDGWKTGNGVIKDSIFCQCVRFCPSRL
jgi:hypothetical protein